jgi:hypothetical protein
MELNWLVQVLALGCPHQPRPGRPPCPPCSSPISVQSRSSRLVFWRTRRRGAAAQRDRTPRAWCRERSWRRHPRRRRSRRGPGSAAAPGEPEAPPSLRVSCCRPYPLLRTSLRKPRRSALRLGHELHRMRPRRSAQIPVKDAVGAAHRLSRAQNPVLRRIGSLSRDQVTSGGAGPTTARISGTARQNGPPRRAPGALE